MSTDTPLLARQALMALITAAILVDKPDLDARAREHSERHARLRAQLVALFGDNGTDDLLRSQMQWFYFCFEQACPAPSTHLPFHAERRAQLREMVRIKG